MHSSAAGGKRRGGEGEEENGEEEEDKQQQQKDEKEEGKTLLSPVTEPLEVSDNPSWLVLEDDFAMVWAVQTSHASTSMLSGPGATLNDGVFTIMVVRACSRLALLQVMLDMETGGHILLPQVEVFRACAYRLEPLTQEGLYSLDGEKIEYGPFQSEMHSTRSIQVMKC